MKPCSPLRRMFACAAIVVPSVVSVQAQIAAAEPESAADVVVLSPFTVSSKSDVGFVAASALAGGRLATDLKDTPAAYSVLTREFIDAINIPDLSVAAKWTVNANNVNDDGRGVMFADELGTKLSFRGVQSTGTTVSQQQIDFFPAYYDYDSFDLDRFDFARGPNSILFGNGSFGGTPNASLKRARGDSRFGETKLTLGSWGFARLTLDENRPITKEFAARVNVLWQDSDTWRDREFNKKKAIGAALTYQPFSHTQIRLNADFGDFQRNIALATDGDRISGWDGVTTLIGTQPVATLPGNANTLGITRLGSSTAAYPVYIDGSGLMNWANTAATLGGNTNGSVPVGGQLVTGAGANYAGGPILDTVNLPGGAFNLATAGSLFRLPGRAFTPGTTDRPSFIQKYNNVTLVAEQQVGQHVFLNLAANFTEGKKTTDYTTVRGLNDVYIDINQTLPSGAPNPNVLVPYDEAIRYLNLTNFNARGIRANVALVYNKTRFGDFRANFEAGATHYNTPRIQYVYTVKDPNLDSRDWPTNNNIRYRYYWNESARPQNDIGSVTLTDPIKGNRTVDTGFVLDSQRQNNTSRTIADFKYAQAALNGRFFKGKLNLLAAVRRDDYNSQADQSLFRRDYAAGWDGTTYLWRPRAPDDYFALQYTPKNAAGVPTGALTNAINRPRDSNGVGLAQYAGDRFQSDYSSPIVKGAITTYSTGAVYHPISWISVFANYAETYNPPSPSIRINGDVFQPLISKGWDAGLRFNLLGEKLVLTATRYAGKQDNVAVGTGTGDGLAFAVPGLFNAIIDANARGDFSAGGINNRGLPEVPAVYFDVAGRKSKGTELELTANPLPGWRVLANVAFPECTQSGAYADTLAYYAANEATLKQVLADAGVLVGSGNVASVDQSIPVNQQSPDASTAAAGWNNLQAVKANFVTESQMLVRLCRVTGNVFTDYTLQSGKLKGLRCGGGVNYRGQEVIGFRGADTIVSPNNPLAAIDDPAVGALTPVYRKSYYTATALLGYTFKLADGYDLVVDLSVDNLFNESSPLYYNTAQRPVNGNLASPARVATPYLYSYQTPRSYMLSMSVKF